MKLGRQPHAIEGFAVALRMRAAVEAFILFLQRMPFLVTDQHDPVVPQACESSPQGPVVANGPVTVELNEVLKSQVEIIKGLRPINMPGYLNGLPGRQVAVLLPFEIDDLSPHPADFVAAGQLAASAGLE